MSTTKKTVDSYNKFAKDYSNYLNSPSNFWNNYLEAPAIVKIISKYANQSNLLDLGCGSGQSSHRWYQLGADVTGLDISDELLSLARQNYPDIKFVKGDVESLLFENASFDVVVASLVLHYLQDFSKVFSEVNRVLKTKGHFVFSINHPMFTSKSKAIIDGKKVAVQTPYFHNNRFQWTMVNDEMVMECYHHTFADITNKLINTGFRIQSVTETQPIPEGKNVNEAEYEKTMLFPSFIVFESSKQ